MALQIIHIDRIVTVDGSGTTVHPNWDTTDTVVANPAYFPSRDNKDAAGDAAGYIREFSVTNVNTTRTICYFSPGVYLVRVTTAGQLVYLRREIAGADASPVFTTSAAGNDYATDAAANTDPTATIGLTTKDAVAVDGQPVNRRHHIVRETEGPRRIVVNRYEKIGMVGSSATGTAVEVEPVG